MTVDLAKAFEHETKGYLNSVSRVLIKNVAKGMSFPDASPPDDQAHSLVKVPLVVARYAGVLFTLRGCVVYAIRVCCLRYVGVLLTLRRCVVYATQVCCLRYILSCAMNTPPTIPFPI